MVKYSAANLDSVFSALGDPTRRAILDRLSTGRASVTQIAKPFNISIAAVSKHLAVLGEAGLIEKKVDGRIHWMHLRSDALKDASAWLDRYEKFWNTRLDALEQLLTSPKRSRK